MGGDPEARAATLAWLERAAELSREGWGHAAPNPLVGCVLVRDGVVVGEGAHLRYGGPHAEVEALAAAGEAARGSEVYVTLEPCNHHGKTPPCVDALISAGVRRVVFGARDPGEKSGGGAERMREAGILVEGPLWTEARSWAENPAFFHRAAGAGRPFVALKFGMSLDGAIAAEAGRPTRITGSESEADVHRLRAGYDAVLVGAGTVRADDPRLTIRHTERGRTPTARLVFTSSDPLPDGGRLYEELDTSPLHFFVPEASPDSQWADAEARGATVHRVDSSDSGLDLAASLARCAELGLDTILCEGGRELGTALLVQGLVDRVILYVSPTPLEAGGLPAFGDGAARALEAFAPALPPATFGGDTKVVLDRRRTG